MKKRAANLVQVEGTAFEGDEISSKMNYEKIYAFSVLLNPFEYLCESRKNK